MEIYSRKVKQLRKLNNWSQQHLADACDVNLRTIQRVENLGVASHETVMAICVAFDIEHSKIVRMEEIQSFNYLPKTELGMLTLILVVLSFGAICGSFFTFWISK